MSEVLVPSVKITLSNKRSVEITPHDEHLHVTFLKPIESKKEFKGNKPTPKAKTTVQGNMLRTELCLTKESASALRQLLNDPICAQLLNEEGLLEFLSGSIARSMRSLSGIENFVK